MATEFARLLGGDKVVREAKMKRLIFIAVSLLLLSACATDISNGVATGMLKTRTYIVTLYASPAGPLYSVRNLDGALLDQDISMETMIARYPDLEHLEKNNHIDWAGLDSELLDFEQALRDGLR